MDTRPVDVGHGGSLRMEISPVPGSQFMVDHGRLSLRGERCS